jgi:DNA-binding transcriptional LysR family regulator
MIPSAAELTYFYEVSETLNLSQAAKKLFISQPSLSRSIQQLELTVGAPLLIRHKKGVVLTPAGKKLQLQIKPLLEAWNNTKVQAMASHNQVEGHVKLGCHSTVGLFIHGFMADLLGKYPKLDIELKHAPSEIITQQIIDFDIDIGIVTNPIHYPDLIIRKIAETDTTLWMGVDNSQVVDVSSGNETLICHPGIRHTEHMLHQCKLRNIKFNRILKVNSIEVIASLTANGCGVGLLPSCFTQSLYKDQLKRISNMPVIKDDLFLI